MNPLLTTNGGLASAWLFGSFMLGFNVFRNASSLKWANLANCRHVGGRGMSETQLHRSWRFWLPPLMGTIDSETQLR